MGYIIKKRRPAQPSYEQLETPLPSEVYSFYGRAEHRMAQDDEEDEETEERPSYFPVGNGRGETRRR